MFSEILDTLLTVVSPSHGVVPLFSSAFFLFVCLFWGSSSFNMRTMRLLSFLKVPHEWTSVGRLLSAVIFRGVCARRYVILLCVSASFS